ncbi:MAG: cytochrome c peroxidase, partial [Pseudomonadota bacterium]
PVGVGAVDPDVVGPGRARPDGLPNVGRHSQSVFNVGLHDAGLFWDLRIESIGKEAGLNGAGSEIRTPDSALNAGDADAGPNLVAAQARFPIVIASEMRGGFEPGLSDDAYRDRIAARIGNYGAGAGELTTNNWLAEFRSAFASAETAENLITFDNIVLAIGEYQRSMVFVDNPWNDYVRGNTNAISAEAKEGALLFYGATNMQGLACANCHGGDFFTDERSTSVGVPQIGIGKGDTATTDGDFGREQQTADPQDRFRFRTPTLLNVAATAPYTHAGAYLTLEDVLAHYVVPDTTVTNYFGAGGPCTLPQFQAHPDCPDDLFENSRAHSLDALQKTLDDRTVQADLTIPDIGFSPMSDGPPILAFMEALTDPCITDRSCVAAWIPDPVNAPDENQLNAVDDVGNPL